MTYDDDSAQQRTTKCDDKARRRHTMMLMLLRDDDIWWWQCTTMYDNVQCMTKKHDRDEDEEARRRWRSNAWCDAWRQCMTMTYSDIMWWWTTPMTTNCSRKLLLQSQWKSYLPTYDYDFNFNDMQIHFNDMPSKKHIAQTVAPRCFCAH